MSTTSSFAGTSYNLPLNREPKSSNWGTEVSNFLIAVAAKALNTNGGAQTLTAELNLGATYGIVLPYLKSASGQLTLNNTGTITVPNATDTLVGRATTDTLTNKTLSGNTATNLISGSGTLTLNTSGSLTLPNVTGTVITSGDTGTISSAMIMNDTIVNADINSAAAIAVTKLAALTASRALVSDGSGFLSASSTTTTELGYVSGVTSAIQTQMNLKAPLASPTFTGTVTLPILVGTDTTDSSSSTTGAFKTAGGLGVAKALFVGGTKGVVVGGSGSGAFTSGNCVEAGQSSIFGDANASYFSHNVYYASGWKSSSNTTHNQIAFDNTGKISFNYAAASTVGTAITWTELGSSTAAGAWTLGPAATASPTKALTVNGSKFINTSKGAMVYEGVFPTAIAASGTAVATITHAAAYEEIVCEVTYTGSNGAASIISYVFAKHLIYHHPSGISSNTTIGTDTVSNATVTFTHSSSGVFTITITNSAAATHYGSFHLKLISGGTDADQNRGITSVTFA